jgi:hypothetical protein
MDTSKMATVQEHAEDASYNFVINEVKSSILGVTVVFYWKKIF